MNILRLLAVAALGALLIGCASSPTETRTPPVIRPVAGLPAAFGDSDPHPWSGRTPRSYAVHGTDVARFQGAVDWPRAKRGGMEFAWIKATEGGDRVDPMFKQNYREAAAAGVTRGAYHFYYFCRPAIEQAQWFIRNVPRTKGALPPVLDMEWNPFSPTCTFRPDPAVVRSEARIFLEALTAHYGTRPVIYSTVDFYDRNGMNQLKGYEFWLRSVAGHPSKVYPGEPFKFWQYSGSGLAPGFYTEVDLNAFNGSTADWAAWKSRRLQR